MAAFFVVEDPFEVNALVQALFAAKFRAHGDELELASSPIVARLCERALDAFVAAQKAGRLPGNSEQTQARFRSRSPGSEVVASVRRHLSAIAGGGTNWDRWSPDERGEYVRMVFRPYVADESLVRELTT